VPEEGELPAYTEVDLSYNRDLFSKTTLTLGVQNLLSTIAPLDDSNPNSQMLTSLYNPRGQVVFAAIKQGF
jgi:outer membrane receptor protein involved in Fe transport